LFATPALPPVNQAGGRRRLAGFAAASVLLSAPLNPAI
jgi:hypothetical protein